MKKKAASFSERTSITGGAKVNDCCLRGLTAAVYQTIAEPIKAVESAIEHAEEALDIVRYFSASNRYPSTPEICSVAGREPVTRPKHLILQHGELISVGTTTTNLRAKHPWRIDDALLSKMRAVGFDTLASLLIKLTIDRTELQKDFVKALAIYSKSCIAQNLTDKLLYAVLTLESVLLKDESESLQKHIGERMAFMIGKSLEARIEIVSNYKKAYALRSQAVQWSPGNEGAAGYSRTIHSECLVHAQLDCREIRAIQHQARND